MRVFLLFIIIGLISSCSGINKVLKNKDPEYKLRMAEQYYVKKKYNFAQTLYEDIMPHFKGTHFLKTSIINMHIVLFIRRII